MRCKQAGKVLTVTLVLVAALAVAGTGDQASGTPSAIAAHLAALSDQDTVTILITDSGLGGLSVAADIEHRFRECHWLKNVRLVFANALFSNDHTYNAMSTTEEKVATFNAALEGFERRYSPDLVLIACNTLSVLYDQTQFSTRSTVPVYGIVDFGVNMIAEHLGHGPGSAILLGTPTTAESGAHLSGLVRKGISKDRITVQACPLLESEIQADPSSDVVTMMIEMFASEAAERRPANDSGPIIVALCCTHYGYARQTFDSVFTGVLGRPVTIVDPNIAMAAAVFDGAECGRLDSSSVSVEVVSRAELTADDIASIGRMIQPTSSATADALRNYSHDTTLFAL